MERKSKAVNSLKDQVSFLNGLKHCVDLYNVQDHLPLHLILVVSSSTHADLSEQLLHPVFAVTNSYANLTSAAIKQFEESPTDTVLIVNKAMITGWNCYASNCHVIVAYDAFEGERAQAYSRVSRLYRPKSGEKHE